MNHNQHINNLTESIIASAIEVHKVLGPGMLESAYEECLCKELSLRKIMFTRQHPVPVKYKNTKLECGYRLDLLIENTVVIEIKSIQKLAPIHEAQLLSYLRLGGWQVGLLINFNVLRLKDGIRRKVLGLQE
jgi:GxxExxY protein